MCTPDRYAVAGPLTYSTVRFWKEHNTSSGSMNIDYWHSL